MGSSIRQCLSIRFKAGERYGMLAQKRAIDYYLGEVRDKVKSGEIGDAFLLLEAHACCFINYKHKDFKIAKAILDEAQKLFERENDPEYFMWGLRIAAHNVKIDRRDEAKSLFDRVSEFIKYVESRKQDDIRLATVMTYNDLKKMREAIKTAHSIKDMGAKYCAFIEIAKAYLESGNKFSAKNILLNECAEVAETDDPQGSGSAKAERLVGIAEILIDMEQNADAERILDKAADSMPEDGPRDWWTGIPFSHRVMEEIAVLLLKVGKRRKAIDLAISTITERRAPGSLTPEEQFKNELYKSLDIDNNAGILRVKQGVNSVVQKWSKFAKALESN